MAKLHPGLYAALLTKSLQKLLEPRDFENVIDLEKTEAPAFLSNKLRQLIQRSLESIEGDDAVQQQVLLFNKVLSEENCDFDDLFKSSALFKELYESRNFSAAMHKFGFYLGKYFDKPESERPTKRRVVKADAFKPKSEPARVMTYSEIEQLANQYAQEKGTTVIITGMMGPPTVNSISGAGDIDVSNLQSGSMLVYNTTTNKWIATRLLDQQTIEAGQF